MKAHIALFILLLLSTTAAAQNTQGTLTAEAVEFRGADATMDLLILKLLAGNGTLPESFRLNAETLRLELDTAEHVIGANTQRVFLLWDTTPSTHNDTTIHGMAPGQEAQWILDKIPGAMAPEIVVDSACLGVEAPAFPNQRTFPIVDQNRPERNTPVSDALRVRPCAEATFTIQGDFRLSLWDWDFRLEDPGATKEVQTGVYPRSDGTGDQATEAYLLAQNATLQIMLPGDVAAFFADHTHFDAPRVRLQSATGALHLTDQDLALQGDTVELQGTLQATVQGQGTQEPVQVDLAGTTLATNALQSIPGPMGKSPGISTSEFTVIVLGLLGLLTWILRPAWIYNQALRQASYAGDALAHNFWQRRRAGLTLLAQRHLDHGRPHRALRLAQRSTALNPIHSDALRIQADALLQRIAREPEDDPARHDVLDEVGQALERAARAAITDPCSLRILLVVVEYHATVGNYDTAQEVLESAAAIDPFLTRSFLASKPWTQLVHSAPSPVHGGAEIS